MISEARKRVLARHGQKLFNSPFDFFRAHGRLRIALAKELRIVGLKPSNPQLWLHMSRWVDDQNLSDDQADEIVASRRKCAGIAMMLLLTYRR